MFGTALIGSELGWGSRAWCSVQDVVKTQVCRKGVLQITKIAALSACHGEFILLARLRFFLKTLYRASRLH